MCNYIYTNYLTFINVSKKLYLTKGNKREMQTGTRFQKLRQIFYKFRYSYYKYREWIKFEGERLKSEPRMDKSRTENAKLFRSLPHQHYHVQYSINSIICLQLYNTQNKL